MTNVGDFVQAAYTSCGGNMQQIHQLAFHASPTLIATKTGLDMRVGSKYYVVVKNIRADWNHQTLVARVRKYCDFPNDDDTEMEDVVQNPAPAPAAMAGDVAVAQSVTATSRVAANGEVTMGEKKPATRSEKNVRLKNEPGNSMKKRPLPSQSELKVKKEKVVKAAPTIKIESKAKASGALKKESSSSTEKTPLLDQPLKKEASKAKASSDAAVKPASSGKGSMSTEEKKPAARSEKNVRLKNEPSNSKKKRPLPPQSELKVKKEKVKEEKVKKEKVVKAAPTIKIESKAKASGALKEESSSSMEKTSLLDQPLKKEASKAKASADAAVIPASSGKGSEVDGDLSGAARPNNQEDVFTVPNQDNMLNEIEELKAKLGAKTQAEVELKAELEAKTQAEVELKAELKSKSDELGAVQDELRRLRRENEVKDQVIEAKTRAIRRLTHALEHE